MMGFGGCGIIMGEEKKERKKIKVVRVFYLLYHTCMYIHTYINYGVI